MVGVPVELGLEGQPLALVPLPAVEPELGGPVSDDDYL